MSCPTSPSASSTTPRACWSAALTRSLWRRSAEVRGSARGAKRARLQAVSVRELSRPRSRARAGKFRDRTRAAEEERQTLTEAIILRQSEKEQSHGAGFETWLRSRGDLKARAAPPCAASYVRTPPARPSLTPGDRAQRSTRATTWQRSLASTSPPTSPSSCLPSAPTRRAHSTRPRWYARRGPLTRPWPWACASQVRCNALGAPSESVEVVTEPIPKELEWGEVLVNIRAMPISPGDLYNIKMGATPYTVRQPAAHPSQWRSGSRTRVALSRMARG